MADGSSGQAGTSPPSFLNASGNPFGTDALYGDQVPAAGSSFDPGAESDALPSFEGDEAASEGSFTETTHVSWFEKLQEAIVGVLVGIVMLLATGAILFWNEGRAVKTYRSLNEGAGLVVDVQPNALDPANEGKLVHLAGDLTAATPVSDPTFGVQAPAARLVRTVEMYQWKEDSRTETTKRVGGGEDRTTTYTYTRVWSDHRNASERFRNTAGHANPQMRYARFEAAATDARLGSYRPGSAALGVLAADRVHPVDPEVATRLASRGGVGPVQSADGALYLGQDAASPRIGDHRVTYHVAPLGPTTFVGRQTGSDVGEYQTKAGDRLLMAKTGTVSAETMFSDAQADNRILTWVIRLAATVFMWVAFFLILRPIAVVGDVIPFIGSALGAGAALAGLLMTVALAPLIIAVAWFFFRPIVTGVVLLGGFALVAGIRVLADRWRAARLARGRPMPAGLRA